MVSAAAQTAAVPFRRSDYDKRIQDNILSLLLRRINETKDSSPLLLKYQRFRELLAENKSTEISQFIDQFQKEFIGIRKNKEIGGQAPKKVVSHRKNTYVNSSHFKKLFPQAEVLFEYSEYGMVARDLLWERVEGGKKYDVDFLPNSSLFKNQLHFNGLLLESYSDNAFDGFKGFQLDFYF